MGYLLSVDEIDGRVWVKWHYSTIDFTFCSHRQSC